MDSLEELWEKFSLTNKEDKKVNLEEDYNKGRGYLAVKFLMKKVLNLEAVLRTMKPLWRATKKFTTWDMGENWVLLNFEDKINMERVIVNKPWSFDKFFILLQWIEDDSLFL